MNVSLEYLQRCSAESGYAVLPLEKVIKDQLSITMHPYDVIWLMPVRE